LFAGGRTCFFEKPMTAMGYDYLKSWMKVYKGKRKYYNLRSALNHNNYGEGSHDLDTLTEELLKEIIGEDGSKEPKLIVRIYSDHGNHQNISHYTQSGDYERHLPLQINVYPKKWAEYHKKYKLKENFTHNIHRFATSLDFFWTDLGIFGGTKDIEGNPKKYGWLVDQVRKERLKIFKKSKGWDDQNWGKDLFGEKLSDNRSCTSLPFFKTYRLD
jgi:hypothetical protein